MRDDNGQMQFEHHQAEEWHEHNRRLLDEIHEIVEKQIKEPKDENAG
jgi:hypothetical protein